MKKAREYWLLVAASEMLAVGAFLSAWSVFTDTGSALYGFYFCLIFGGLGLILRALSAREARFLRRARRVRAEISGLVLNPRGDARGTNMAEVGYRYWPEEGEPHEGRALLPRSRATRLRVGQPTTVFLGDSGRSLLESSIHYHRLQPYPAKKLSQ